MVGSSVPVEFATLTVTSSLSKLNPSSRAWTVTRYSLSPLASAGFSKSGTSAKVNTPVTLISKSPPSVPDTDQVIVLPSGSAAWYVYNA